MSEKEALLQTKRIFCNSAPPQAMPSPKVHKCAEPPGRCCAVKSHLAHLQHSKTLEKHENKKLF